jgi:copper chaperone
LLTLKVDGMTCGHCERAVTEAIHAVDPGAAVQVDRPGGIVSTDSQAEPQRLAAAIQAEGYEARPL